MCILEVEPYLGSGPPAEALHLPGNGTVQEMWNWLVGSDSVGPIMVSGHLEEDVIKMRQEFWLGSSLGDHFKDYTFSNTCANCHLWNGNNLQHMICMLGRMCNMFCMEHEVSMAHTYRSDTDIHVYANYISLKETPLPQKRKKTNLWFKEKSNSQSKIDFEAGRAQYLVGQRTTGLLCQCPALWMITFLCSKERKGKEGRGGERRGEGRLSFSHNNWCSNLTSLPPTIPLLYFSWPSPTLSLQSQHHEITNWF